MPKKQPYNVAQYYNEHEIDILLSKIKGDPLESFILFAVFYGMRRSGILGLKWNAIDFKNSAFVVRHTVVRVDKQLHKIDSTKTPSSNRSMPMPSIIIDALKKLKAEQTRYRELQPIDYIDEGYIFTREDGRLILPGYVSKHFKYLLIKNDLRIIRFHDLRHSSASYLLYLGFSMKEIQIWLGRGDIGTTMNLYTHVDLAAKRNIANSLNERFERFGKFGILEQILELAQSE